MPRRKKLDVPNGLEEKLKYIGLDLNKIPKKVLEFENPEYRVSRVNEEKQYKQYRFVSVDDIEILLTPANRLDDIKERYSKATPLYTYLDTSSEKNALRYTTFLQMIEKVQISEIKKIENEQQILSKKIPFKVKFQSNYLWQIYYSKKTDKYFMLVPTEDSDYSTFFYLLKKKIEAKKGTKIYVPISNIEYSNPLLKKSEIEDMSNYIWLFTKDWPAIYEVYDKYDKLSIIIVGETEVYNNLKSLYRMEIPDKIEANKFFKLLKALFILQTELPSYYDFKTNIDENGEIEFYFEDVKLDYDNLVEFIDEQYLKVISLQKDIVGKIDELETKLEKLKIETREIEQEYVEKEKQISTFLECKKTFFGKVKYFFKYSRKNKKAIMDDYYESDFNKPNFKPKRDEERINFGKNHTLDELIEKYKKYEADENKMKNVAMDIDAIKLKKKNLSRKLSNATAYIEEIEKHRKSIFDFWKYTNKDEVQALEEGEKEEINIKRIEKVFNYEEDFENFGKQMDKIQRNVLTDNELEAVYITTTEVLDLLNKENNGTVLNKELTASLKELKTKAEQEKELFKEEFDFFGKFSDDKTKIKTLANKNHRETQRNKYEILQAKRGTKTADYKQILDDIIENLYKAMQKIELQQDIYVYKATSNDLEADSFTTFSLNPEIELKKALEDEKIYNKMNLYNIKISKGTNLLAFTNIIYYDNKNMTLPLGMDISNNILVNTSNLNFQFKNIKEIRKIEFENEKDDLSKAIVRNIKIYEGM